MFTFMKLVSVVVVRWAQDTQLLLLLVKAGCEKQRNPLFGFLLKHVVRGHKQKQLDALNKTRSTTLPVEIQNHYF